ncbi:hypothetical protein UT300005_16880 [Clostridium sp. CTA-5]
MIINYENVKIELPYEILHIEKLHLKGNLNEHYMLSLHALIEEENVEQYLGESVEGKQIKLLINENVIYIGKIIEVQISYKKQVAHLNLKTISYSYNLDIKRHSKVFSNLKTTYQQVIKEVLNKYTKADFIDNVTYEKCIKDLIVQYKETDFEFLKRLATHFETVLVVDPKADASFFTFGIEPIYKAIELDSTFREAKTSFDVFNKISCFTDKDLFEQNFIGWRASGKEYIPLGTEVVYEGQRVCVVKVDMKIYNGEITYLYELKFLKGIITTYEINSKLKGISLEGMVKNRKNNEMQIHFCINDSYQDNKDNKWFYYGREAGNFYTMPELGSKVHIRFLTGDEKDTIITNAIRIVEPNAKYYSKILNSKNKSYSTVEGQELLMTPDNIQITQDNGKSIQVDLQKSGDVSIKGGSINIHSSKNIEIGTKKPYIPKKGPLKPTSINISAKNKVVITRSSSNAVNTSHAIELMEENHLKGTIKLG